MTEIDDGGLAHCHSLVFMPGHEMTQHDMQQFAERMSRLLNGRGLTVRDWLVGQALQGAVVRLLEWSTSVHQEGTQTLQLWGRPSVPAKQALVDAAESLADEYLSRRKAARKEAEDEKS